MLFTSYEFIAYLAIMFAAYFLTPSRWQWVTLLVGSYVFYAFAGLECLIFILFTTVTAYIVSILMKRAIDRENEYIAANKENMSKDERKAYRGAAKKKRLAVLTVGLVLNFGVLAVIKYSAFAVNNVNAIMGLFGKQGFAIPSLLLPMGISFYIFQTMGYLIDVYRAKVEPERNLAKLALFVSFFPQLVQGPISRFGDLASQLTAPHKFNAKSFTFGLQRILWGYFKKLVIADRVLVVMRTLLDTPEQYNGAYVLLLVLVYSVQIYADFTGGIDITIGIAEAMGIRLAENFNRPFSSKSTKEYWKRWHITMGTWFDDYIFKPTPSTRPMLALNKKVSAKFGRKAGARTIAYIGMTLTWLATGIWHGAGWNFIVWGLLNCAVIMVSEMLEPIYKRFRERFPKFTATRGYGYFMSARTFLLMGVIRSLDCYRNVGLTFSKWGSMLTMRGLGDILKGGIFELGLGIADVIVVCVGILVMFAVSKISANGSIRERLYGRYALSWTVFGALFVCIIIFGAYGIGYDSSQFIYNQF